MPQTIDAGAEGRAVVNLNRFDRHAGNHLCQTQASGIFTGKSGRCPDTTKRAAAGQYHPSGVMQVTQTVNDAALPVAFQTLNLTAELRNNRADWLDHPPDQ